MKRLVNTQFLLWLALALALLGSLTHVAWGFSTLENGDLVMGFVQAIAVDVGLFAIAIGIQQNRRDGRSTTFLWGGVFFFAMISTYANLLHGLAFARPLNLPGWEWLVGLRPFLLSAVLPILVIYLSEVAAANWHHQMRQALLGEQVRLDVPLPMLANLFLDNWKKQHGKEPTVPEFVHYFERQTGGHRVDDAAADEYVLQWRSQNSVVGARPVKPVLPVPGYRNGNGNGVK